MRSVILLPLVLIVVTVLPSCNSSDSPSGLLASSPTVDDQLKDGSTRTTVLASDSIVPDLDDLPAYPDARQVQSQRHRQPDWTLTTFETSNASASIISFYRNTFTKNGWSVSSTADKDSLAFSWLSPNGMEAPNLDVYVSVYDLPKGGTSVQLFARTWPDPNKLPIFPGAKQVSISYQQHPTMRSLWQRITTYTIDEKVGSIEDFYRSMLPQQGWELEQTSHSIDSADGICFVYVRGTSYQEDLGGSVVITAQPKGDGQVEITLTAAGSEITPVATP